MFWIDHYDTMNFHTKTSDFVYNSSLTKCFSVEKGYFNLCGSRRVHDNKKI